ncbi:hypothetical protein SAY86_023078 [Trapa natans]|uniref:Uncharacterized protein n=1 Tax=Trapa natans TaxID=22666 RepID=A0AAN7LPF0_TRANT|nr:hypothetical protein SAY86_023078 [Trapa natans]
MLLQDCSESLQDCSESLHERTLKEVRNLIGKVKNGSLESLEMVDTLQRHGISYNFEKEIKSILREHFTWTCNGRSDSDNIYEIALRFRLLRQEGYNVPADVFECFMSQDDNTGKLTFDKKMTEDIIGLTSMYEASLLSIDGEDMLHEAAMFSKNALTASEKLFSSASADTDINGTNSPTLKELVKNTLLNPFHKSLPRFNSWSSKVYPQGPYEWTEAFRKLAILDSEMVASINRREAVQVTRWWKDLGLAKQLNFARDQPLKWYTWSMAILPDPKLSKERLDITKPIAMVYIIDDLFDVYGSLDELTLLTEAITRWECMEELPDCMKACFRALDDITNEISNNVYMKQGWNPTYLIKQAWKDLCDAFLVEARWLTSSHFPSAEEYLRNAIITSGVHVVFVHLFAHLCEDVTGQDLDMLNRLLAISTPTAKILRLWDDLGSATDENQEGRDGSFLDYYIKENHNCSMEGARKHVMEMISDAWRDLNRECLFSPSVLKLLAKVSLNTARMVPLMYTYDKDGCLPRIQTYMKSLMFNASD